MSSTNACEVAVCAKRSIRTAGDLPLFCGLDSLAQRPVLPSAGQPDRALLQSCPDRHHTVQQRVPNPGYLQYGCDRTWCGMARALTCHERLLHNAARSGDVSTVRRVLQYHRDAVDVNRKDMQFYGYSALHWAAFKGFLDILIALVDDGGADVNNITVAHWTALHLASQAGHGRVCRWLIESGEANLELLTTVRFVPPTDRSCRTMSAIAQDAKSATTVAADQSTSAIILEASERSRRRLLCIRITGCHRHLSGPLCDRQLVRLIMSHIKVSEYLGTM